jgi:tRNA(Ile)-lysidine synthase
MRDEPAILLARVGAFLQARGLLRPDALLLVAVSGGPDSLALLHLLSRLRAQGGPSLHVAHLDHGARGAQSAAEAAAVAELAAAWGLPATVGRADVPALARERREGLMAAARRARYAFLAEAALQLGASAVAVAHHADDQAETVLMHLLRGAGPAGLRGMRDVVPWAEWGGAPGGAACEGCPLIRPLLTTTRAEVEAYCREHGLRPSDDPSNRSERFARPRIRRTLRALEAEHPRVIAALGRAARILADDHAFIQAQLDSTWPRLADAQPGWVSLRREEFLALHPALQRYALRRAAALLGQAELSLEQVEAARALAAAPGRQMRLGPRLWLAVDQVSLAFARTNDDAVGLGGTASPAPQLGVAELPLAAPGRTPLGGGWACEVRVGLPPAPSPWWVALDPAALDGPLILRRRRPGDRFRPAGGAGSRKLQDFFVDRKLPRALRAAWPILATPSSVVWVAGLRADERFAATDPSQGTIWVGLTHDHE